MSDLSHVALELLRTYVVPADTPERRAYWTSDPFDLYDEAANRRYRSVLLRALPHGDWRELQRLHTDDEIDKAMAQIVPPLTTEGDTMGVTDEAVRTYTEAEKDQAVMEAVEDFKDRVARLARRAAIEENWCAEGERDALASLGIKALPSRARFTFQVSFEVNTRESDASKLAEHIHNDDSDWIESTYSFQVHDDGDGGTVDGYSVTSHLTSYELIEDE